MRLNRVLFSSLAQVPISGATTVTALVVDLASDVPVGIPAGVTFHARMIVVANDGGANHTSFEYARTLQGGSQGISGLGANATQVVAPLGSAGLATMTADITTSGSRIICTVTGVAATNLVVECHLELTSESW